MTRRGFSLGLLIAGALVFLAVFLVESGRELFPYLWDLALNPSDHAGLGDLVAVSAFLLLTLLTLSSPILGCWLERSRMMRGFFRVLSAISTLILSGCAVAWHDTANSALFILVASAGLNLSGLLALKPSPQSPTRSLTSEPPGDGR